jgi:hypothetical protein
MRAGHTRSSLIDKIQQLCNSKWSRHTAILCCSLAISHHPQLVVWALLHLTAVDLAHIASAGLCSPQVSSNSNITVTATPQTPSPPRDCPRPHLGKLCGKDAAGGIVGIAIGSAVLVGLIVTAMYWSFADKVRRFDPPCVGNSQQ